MQVKVVINHQIQGMLYGLRDFNDFISILIKTYVVLLLLVGKNVKAKGRRGTFSEWLFLSSSQVISKGYSEICSFKWLY